MASTKMGQLLRGSLTVPVEQPDVMKTVAASARQAHRDTDRKKPKRKKGKAEEEGEQDRGAKMMRDETEKKERRVQNVPTGDGE